MKKIKDADVDESPDVSRVTAILSYSRGFACSLGAGTVCLFEKTEEDGYRRSREIRVNVHAGNGGTVGVCVSFSGISCVLFSVRSLRTRTAAN